MIWNNLQYFKKTENWGDPDKMNPEFLILLDNIRDIIGYPISINCGYSTNGHATKSQHYLGNAVDFVVLGVSMQVAYELIIDALDELGMNDKVGLGVYPFWNTQGFHIDLRGNKARWSRAASGKYVSIFDAVVGD